MRNKVRVTSLMGAGADQGLIDPAVNMKVKHGIDTRWIVSVTDDVVNLALSSGGAVKGQAYPHECLIATGDAAIFGWPSTGGSVKFGHHGAFPNGVPHLIGSGMTYEDGGGNEISFSRAANPS